MSFLIACPNCGVRRVDEYAYGGEYGVRPDSSVSEADWGHYLYARRNPAGRQTEWWYHRLGCRRWFLADRDVRANEVLRTYWHPTPGPLKPVQGVKHAPPIPH